MTEKKVSVSVMCMDYTEMGKQFELLNEFTDAYHWDIMDGNYVPNVSLNFEMLETLGHAIKKPIQAHLMVVRPQDYVERLIDWCKRRVSHRHGESADLPPNEPFRKGQRWRGGCD